MADKAPNQIPMPQQNQNMPRVPDIAQNKNPQDKNTLLAVLQLLRKYNLKDTEELLKKEANLEDGVSEETPQSDSEVSSVLSAYKSEGDPEAYEGAYADLKKFVEGALDIYKHELGMILYPVFVHMYLELVYNNHEEQAVRFMEKFGPDQDDYYQDDLKRLSHVTKKDHMKGNELTDTFKSSQFIIRMSRDTLSILKRHLQEKKHSVVLNIIQEHLYFDMYEGVARNKQQIEATAGAVVGEATRQDNKAKVYYGLLKEPDIQYLPAEEEEEGEGEGVDKPKKKKAKKDPLFSKKTKTDPNAPPVDRMPLPDLELIKTEKCEKWKELVESLELVNGKPWQYLRETVWWKWRKQILAKRVSDKTTGTEGGKEAKYNEADLLMLGKDNPAVKGLGNTDTGEEVQLCTSLSNAATPPSSHIREEKKDADKLEKVKALREASKRVNLGPDTLPSICFYTLLNSSHIVTSAEVAEDSSLMAVGFIDSMIKVWTLVPQKLRAMKAVEQLQDIDKEADDVLVRMMDDRSAETCRILHGHNGPVYRVAFSPDRTLLLSCSEDTTVRLWSLQTWTCLVCYKGHIFPVWDVRFAPHGYYFATAGHDKTARLWATDQHQPLRIFAGHFSDVDCLQFHPNSNYVATGSSDRTVRLWDCVTGSHVRLMTGHKGPIYTLCFSVDGRFLASAGADCRVLIWDLAHGHLLAELTGHKGPIHTLAFSRDGHILTSGSLDHSIKLWHFTHLTDEMVLEDVNISHNPDIKKSDSYLLRSYGTKNSPVLHLHFTRRNVLLAVGMYEGS